MLLFCSWFSAAWGGSREVLWRQLCVCRCEWVNGYLTLCCCFAAGFLLPEEGLERFCGGSSVYVGVEVDSYDQSPEDQMLGQVNETLETNNVLWHKTAITLAGLTCNDKNIAKSCKSSSNKLIFSNTCNALISHQLPYLYLPVITLLKL